MSRVSRNQALNQIPRESPRAVIRLTQALPRANELEVLGLVAAEARALNRENDLVALRIGAVELPATLHPSVDPVVVLRAIERRELVIAQQQDKDWVVIGVLRTSATPGLDVGDEYVIEARRVTVRAEHELVLTSGLARFAIAAIGRIEGIARNITTRASAVNKVIGRVVQLN
jgi:hypothetical protein